MAIWRPSFLLAGVLLSAGGMQHPRGGGMAVMLADPKWLLSHSLLLTGFVLLLIGLMAYARTETVPDRTRTWLWIAAVATTLQAAEMVFHTAAVVDGANLLAGRPTPVLTTHLWLAIVCYPAFGVGLAGLLVAGARDRALGSPWIVALGVVGALAHGAAPLVSRFFAWGPILFPMLLLFALWLMLTAVWPRPTLTPRSPAERVLTRA